MAQEEESTQKPRAEASAEPGLVESFVGSYPVHVLETLPEAFDNGYLTLAED